MPLALKVLLSVVSIVILVLAWTYGGIPKHTIAIIFCAMTHIITIFGLALIWSLPW
jgi:hypothetical protein